MPATASDGWFTEVVNRYERPLVAYALRHVHDLEAARDCVQDVFVKLFQARSDGEADIESRLAQWLFTVCRHRCIDHLRSHAVARKDADMDLAHQADTSTPLAQRIDRSDTSAQVMAAIDHLPEKQQLVIRLKFQEGLSYADISARTALSVANVGFLLSTGLATLRQHFAPVQEARS